MRVILTKRMLPNSVREYRLAPDIWLEIQQRAKHESLRQLAPEETSQALQQIAKRYSALVVRRRREWLAQRDT